MEKGKISVIVPVYNVERYLHRSLDAIINQTYKNLEILLVDDGSKDSSGKICDEYEKKDGRIRVIHKINAGAGQARNTALEYATGEYIVFVDSDDYLELDMYEKMYQAASANNADLVICGAAFIDSNNKIRRSNANPFISKKAVFKGEETRNILLNMLEMGGYAEEQSKYPMDMALWKGMFRHNLIKENKIEFYSEREYKSEDFIFYADFLPLCDCIVLLDEALYYHCDNENSISHNYSFKVQVLNNAMLDKLLETVDKHNLGELYQLGAKKVYLEASYIVILDEFRNQSKRSYRNIRSNMRFVCEDQVFCQNTDAISLFKNERKKYVIMQLMKKKCYLLIYWISMFYYALRK